MIFTNWAVANFLLAFAVSGVAFLMFILFPFHEAFATAEGRQMFGIVCCNVVLFVLPNMLSTFLRVERRATTSAVIAVLSALLSATFSLLLVFKLEWGIQGFYLGQSLSWILISILALMIMRRYFAFPSFEFKELVQMVKYGVSFVPANITTQLTIFINGLLLLHLTSQSDLGLFQVGNTLAMAIMLFILPFNSAFQPFSYSIINEDYAPRVYALVLDIYTAIMASVTLVIGLFFKEVVELLLKPSYFDSYFIASILVFAQFIYGMNVIAVLGMSKLRKLQYFGLIISIGNLLNIPLTYMLAKQMGIQGAAVATLVMQTLMIVLLFYASQKVYYIPFRFGRNILLASLSFSFFLIGYLFIRNKPESSLDIRLLLFFIFMIVGVGVHRVNFLSFKKAYELKR